MHDKPVFVTHYLRGQRRDMLDRNEKVVENFDLWPRPASARSSAVFVRTITRLLAQIKQEGYNPQDYECTSTAQVWLGAARRLRPRRGNTVAWITGEKHIRQCIAFPRMMDKVYI